MDKVKCILRIHPFPLDIIYDEFDIWRNPLRLNRADIISDNMRFGKLAVAES